MATVESAGRRPAGGRLPLLCAAVVLLLVLASLPWRDRSLGLSPAFLGVWVALLVTFDLLTAALLLSRYRAGGSRRLLLLAWAFLWSATAAAVFAAAVPGALASGALLPSGPNQIYWLWLARYVGTPVVLAVALASRPARRPASRPTSRPTSRPATRAADPTSPAGAPEALLAARDRRRRRVVVGSWGGVLLGVLLLTLVARTPDGWLPRLVDVRDDGTAALTAPVAATVVVVNALAVAVAVAGVLRRRPGLEAWTVVASAAYLGAVVLSVLTGPQVTVASYLAQLLGLASGAVVLLALLHEVGRLEARATHDAARLEEHNAALLEAQRLRDHLTAVVSHDLRTPLAGLQGYLELLLDDTDAMAEPLVHRMHERSWMLTRRMTLLTEDLLAASTLGHGDLVVSPVTVDLAGQLAECVQVFPDLDVRVSCPPGATVVADPLRLQQILANLVRNAQKHGAEPVTLTAACDAGGVVITVCDAGPGVPASFVPRMFERYTQADPAGGSSGLGLSVVRDLVAAHRGGIRYDAEIRGFVLTLPPPAVTATPATPGAAQAPVLVLRGRDVPPDLRPGPRHDPGAVGIVRSG